VEWLFLSRRMRAVPPDESPCGIVEVRTLAAALPIADAVNQG
jgi:hypothetical protein